MSKLPASGPPDSQIPTPPIHQSDSKNLYLIQQNKSTIDIKVDPTITNVSDIELTPPTPIPSSPCQTSRSTYNYDQSTLPICTSSLQFHDIGAGSAPSNLDQLSFDEDSPQQQLNTERSHNRRFSIKIPSNYVHNRFRDLNDQVHIGRRNRTITYYRNYFITAICNIIIFYILFSIGIGILYIWSVPINTFLNSTSTVQQRIGCQCIPTPTVHTNQPPPIQNIQNNTVIKYLPPLFWDRWRSNDLVNLTVLLTNMIDIYFATTGAEFLSNASDIISNKTINQIQTIVLDKLTVNKITTNAIDAVSSNITSIIAKNISSRTINAISVISVSLFGNTLNKCNQGKC